MRSFGRLALCLTLAMCLALTGSAPAFAKTSATPLAAKKTKADVVEQTLKGMTLKEKIGQMFLVDCPEDGAKWAEGYHPGGYVLFAKDFEGKTPSGVKKTIQSYQNASKIPMLIAVDEEGGSVTRVSRFTAFRAKPFPSPQAVYKAGGGDAIKKDVRDKAALLKPLGINVNLAPVADLPTSSQSFIYGRSFGTSASLTSKFVSAVVTESRKAGLGAVLKHFPGYGDNSDTHTGVAVDARPLKTFEERDFLPFQAGIKAGAQAVLVSHNIVTSLDRKYPASLSKKAHAALRNLGFDGVAMTDDLNMGAITEGYGQAEAAVMAVEAGNDMLITADFKTGMVAVLRAVQSGRIKESRLNESVRRILKWKHDLGLI